MPDNNDSNTPKREMTRQEILEILDRANWERAEAERHRVVGDGLADMLERRGVTGSAYTTTLRNQFAMAALTGILASDPSGTEVRIVDYAFSLADRAMGWLER